MKPKKTLPPELQTLVDKYNTLLEEYGFNMPYMDTGFENYDFEGKASYSSPDEEASDNDWGFKADAAWRESKVPPEEWNSRVDKINDLYNNIIDKAVKYSNEGKIEFLPDENKEDTPTYAYDRVFEPSTGRTVWLSHQASPLPRFKSAGRDDISPMKSKGAGERAEVERPGLQKPRPMDLPSLKKELIMRTNPNMRTGQEPNYYVVKDGNRKRVQPVEQEELDYYREKNRVKKPAYGGKYSFEEGGRFKAVKKAEKGMRVKKANQGMVFGDPVKHQAKTRALGPDDRIMYVPAGEGAEEDPENYLNLAKLDSILESSYDGALPFGAFRDQVRKVEAGPYSKDPYRQRQEVEVDGEVLEVGVGRGAYQFDYPTAQTAYQRLKAIADKRDLDYPDLSDEDLRDVSKLDPEIQDMLFTAHFAKDPATSVEKVLMDDENWADQWQVGHYKGEKDRREHFRSLQQ